MAKLKNIDFKFPAKVGDPLHFSAVVNVSAAGVFSVSFPDVMLAAAQQVCESHGHLFGVNVVSHRNGWRAEAATLAACTDFVTMAGKEFMTVAVTEELVLVYSHEKKVAYVKDAKGGFFENGSVCRDAFEAGTANWHGNLSATTLAPAFRVGLFARVYKKLTYTRSGGSSVEYEYFRSESGEQKWLGKLNGFIGLHVRLDELHKLPQMPYTEEAAHFFYESLLTMCKLADQVDSLFGSTENVRLAIGKGPLQLGR